MGGHVFQRCYDRLQAAHCGSKRKTIRNLITNGLSSIKRLLKCCWLSKRKGAEPLDSQSRTSPAILLAMLEEMHNFVKDRNAQAAENRLAIIGFGGVDVVIRALRLATSHEMVQACCLRVVLALLMDSEAKS